MAVGKTPDDGAVRRAQRHRQAVGVRLGNGTVRGFARQCIHALAANFIKQ